MKQVKLLALSLLMALSSCKKEDNEPSGNNGNNQGQTVLNLPDTPLNCSNLILPKHFNAPAILAADNTPNSNPITDEGATLGRVLFLRHSTFTQQHSKLFQLS
ncbi:MAG: hypothetical protein J4F31_06765 [Flavobacteriales bacterium]|nr:hypothetical protein [Flavobacteriales bacterium]